jgi:site-specific recombinase XerD
LAPQGDKQLCPVQALNVLLQFRPKIDGILFCHFDGWPLTKYQFSSMLKRSLSVLGMSDSKLSSHSFRMSMATRVQLMDIQMSKL